MVSLFNCCIALATCVSLAACSCNCMFEDRVSELERKVEFLLSENVALHQKLQEHSSTRYAKQGETGSVESNTIQADVDLPSTNSSTYNEATKSRSRLAKRSVESAGYAFHVYLSGNKCFGSHETFVFDREEIDVGDGYNSKDGIYTAPETGVYVFALTIIPGFFKYVQAEIVVNGVVKGRAFADSDEIHDYHPASTTIVVHANAGDHVFVRRGTSTNCDIVSAAYPAWTTFSGWMLF